LGTNLVAAYCAQQTVMALYEHVRQRATIEQVSPLAVTGKFAPTGDSIQVLTGPMSADVDCHLLSHLANAPTKNGFPVLFADHANKVSLSSIGHMM